MLNTPSLLKCHLLSKYSFVLALCGTTFALYVTQGGSVCLLRLDLPDASLVDSPRCVVWSLSPVPISSLTLPTGSSWAQAALCSVCLFPSGNLCNTSSFSFASTEWKDDFLSFSAWPPWQQPGLVPLALPLTQLGYTALRLSHSWWQCRITDHVYESVLWMLCFLKFNLVDMVDPHACLQVL